MYRQCFILTILLLSTMLGPITFPADTAFLTNFNDPLSMIETRLKMEIAANQELGTSAILEFSSELTAFDLSQIEKTGIEFVRRGNKIVNVGKIYSAIIHDSNSLHDLVGLGLIRATSGNKQYFPSLASSVPAIRADDVWNNLQRNGNSIDGSGATVAVIDTGADWLHPSFWRAYDAEFDFIYSAPYYYIDLDGDMVADPNEGPILTVNGQIESLFSYSSDYMYVSTDGNGAFDYADGDNWIGGIDANDDGYIDRTSEKAVILNISKVSILYDQFASNVYIRGVNLTQAISIRDSNSLGHGTHVSSTIAGGQVGMTSQVGVAPGADLIIIRSPLNSADIIDGISFAIEHDADIINMSFSSYLGFLDGTDPEDLAVTEAFLKYGMLTTAAAGNLGGKPKHARFTVPSGNNSSVLLDVDNEKQYSYLSILWRSSDRDEHIILNPPSGEPIDLGAYYDIAGNAFALTEETLSAYVFCEISPRGMNNIIIQVSTPDHGWLDGTWEIVVENPSGENILIDGYAWDGTENAWSTTDLEFLSQRDNYHTISSPATSDFAIAVSSYSEASSSITLSSSRGPRIDGAAKPDIAAPGASIIAARNSLTNLWWAKDGTSMASPHIAGAIALILQAEGDNNPWRAYTALVNGAGGLSNHNPLAVNDFGHGLCDVALSVMHVLNESIQPGSTQSDWSIIEPLASDSLDPMVSPGLDIRLIKVFQQTEDLAFLVTTTASNNFSGTDMLSVEWNTDSNPSTGINGADILLNLTSSVLQIYEWTGSTYEVSALDGSWWNDSNSLFLRVEGLTEVTRGSIVVATHNSTMKYVDSTDPSELVDTWRPLIDNLAIESVGDALVIEIVTNDRDSPVDENAVGISIVDGGLLSLNSTILSGSNHIEYAIDFDFLYSEYVSSLIFNATSETQVTISPLVILSGSINGVVRFTSAVLDNFIVRVGFFIDEKITGEITLEGYELASEVLIGFQHASGVWRNFTLSGEGLYEFVIASSGFISGEYDVYAIAKGSSIKTAQMLFATLMVIVDNTLIVVGIVAVIAGLVMIFAVRRLRK